MRPMMPSEFTDACFGAYRAMGWSILKATMVPAVFVVASLAFVFEFVIPSFFVTSNAGNIQSEVTEAIIALGFGFVVGLPLMLIGLALSTSLIIFLTAEYVAGNVPDLRFAAQNARRRWKGIMLLQLRQFGLAFGGFVVGALLLLLSGTLSTSSSTEEVLSGAIAFIAVVAIGGSGLVALVMLGRELLVTPAYAVEGTSAREAARRGIKLLGAEAGFRSGWDSVGSLLGIIIFFIILMLIGISTTVAILGGFDEGGSIVRELPYGEFIEKGLGYIPVYLAVWLVIPMWGIGATVLYFERRVRKEGYDVELLAQDVWKRTRGTRFQI